MTFYKPVEHVNQAKQANQMVSNVSGSQAIEEGQLNQVKQMKQVNQVKQINLIKPSIDILAHQGHISEVNANNDLLTDWLGNIISRASCDTDKSLVKMRR